MAKARRRWTFYASLPERGVRAGAAGLGGALHETFELALPRFVRRSRFYEATAKNLLRVAIELVGGVERRVGVEDELSARDIAVRKGAGNVVELGSIAAFGFSPLWLLAAAAGLWLGRRMEPTPGIERLLAGARSTNTLPEVEPGAIVFNRLWPLAVFTILSGAAALFVPQVPAIAAGYAIGVALTWRKQAAGVQAVEDRDGVRFYFDRSSPFGAPKLLRTPGLRKVEPVAQAVPSAAPRRTS